MKIASLLSIPEAKSIKRNLGLDALRVAAILLVVFSHGMALLPSLPSGQIIFCWTGFFGVELFFVLSGYLIGSILLESCLSSHSVTHFRLALPDFWVRRWFRTLPNYYVFLGVALCTATQIHAQYLVYVFFGQNLFWRCGGLMPLSWSLAIEEWFYLAFPLVVLAFYSKVHRPRLAFGLATVFVIVISISLRSFAAFSPGVDWDEDLRKIVGLRLDSIAYGALMMLLMRTWPDRLRRASRLLLVAGITGVAISVCGVKHELCGKLPPLLMANLFTLVSISAACLLPYAVYRGELASASRVRTTLAGVSIISYSMYLLHTIAFKIARHWLWMSTWYVQYLSYLSISFILSIVVYNLYERRMTALRDRYARKTAVEL